MAQRIQSRRKTYRVHPDCLSQAAISVLWVRSHCVIDRVSLSSIFSFMQMQ
jgi:hypothetical protein